MSKDDKARDVLGKLKARRPAGDRLTSRVGSRAWERPNVSVSSRIFKLYRLADPWDPDAPDDGGTVLGPVNVRLGEKRREPAPHASPREPKGPKVAAPAAPQKAEPAPRPTGVEKKPPPEARPAPAEPRPRKEPPPPPAAVGKYQLSTREEVAAAFSAPGRRDQAASGKQPLRRPLPMRPGAETASRARDASPEAKASAGSAAGRSLVRPEAPPEGRRTSARFSMKPTAVTSPVERQLLPPEEDAPPVEPVAAAPEAAAAVPVIPEPPPPPPKAEKPKPEKQVDRTPFMKSGGLDDLFGAAMDGGRMKIPKARKTTGTGED